MPCSSNRACAYRQTCDGAEWERWRWTGCCPRRRTGSQSHSAAPASPPSDWSSRCSPGDTASGARLSQSRKSTGGLGCIGPKQQSICHKWNKKREIKKSWLELTFFCTFFSTFMVLCYFGPSEQNSQKVNEGAWSYHILEGNVNFEFMDGRKATRKAHDIGMNVS